MQVVMDVRRHGEQYQGSLTRVSDEFCIPFAGVLELLAALERLHPDELESDPPGPLNRDRSTGPPGRA